MADERYSPHNEEERSNREGNIEQRRPHKWGEIHRFEPTYLKELLASPITVTSFKWLACFAFCEQVQAVQYHPKLTRLFIAKIQDNQVSLASITFTFSIAIKSATTGIPEVRKNGSSKVK